jgi:hypothetical protein
MAQSEVSGTFTATPEGDHLKAIFTRDPKVDKREGRPFLVYELTDECTPPEASRIPPAAHRPVPVNFKADLVGCFFADSALVACEDAARYFGRLGDFIAVKGTHVELDFAQRTPDASG